jgi:hypothetical protein
VRDFGTPGKWFRLATIRRIRVDVFHRLTLRVKATRFTLTSAPYCPFDLEPEVHTIKSIPRQLVSLASYQNSAMSRLGKLHVQV